MKKSLLALAVVAVAASANAATVYEKDGTSLTLDGRVQSVYYSVNHKSKHTAAENDSRIKNSARFGIGGKTQITDWVAGFGYAQWDTADGSKDEGFAARDQYVGADFGDFGKVQAGRFRDSGYYVENLTDHYEDAAGTISGTYNGDRRGGQLMYTYDNYGFHGQLGIQTSQDSGKVAGASRAVDSGFNAALGYKIDDVLFGPLEFRTGYSYIKGQKGNDLKKDSSVVVNTAGASVVEYSVGNGSAFDKFRHANFGVAWGNLNSGLYLAAIFDYAKLTGLDRGYNKTTGAYVEGGDKSSTNKGFELSVGYAFDNGLSALLGYEGSYWKFENAGVEKKYKVRRIPLFINYKLNPNFNVWTEFGFNAGSDHKDDINAAQDKAYSRSLDKNYFSVGARYTF